MDAHSQKEMNKEIIISIIIPIFNAQKTLKRMLDSLRAQTFQDYEVIMIDDGSTDNSSGICDEYVKSDSRFKAIHQSNAGVAMARKKGIENACGEYSIHVDADDWVEPTMLEEMYWKARTDNADIVICDYFILNNDGSKIYKQQKVSLNPNETLKRIFEGDVFGALWNKLIRTELYQVYKVQFFKDINYCEDVLVCAQILKSPDVKISHLKKAYYCYYMNNDSITHKVSKHNYNGLLLLQIKIKEILCDVEYRICIERLDLSVFLLGFVSKTIAEKDISKEFRKVEKIAYVSTKSIKMKLGFFFIRHNCIAFARKLIRF